MGGFYGNSTKQQAAVRQERKRRREYHHQRAQSIKQDRRPWTPLVPESRRNYKGTIDARSEYHKRKTPLEEVQAKKPWSPFARSGRGLI